MLPPLLALPLGAPPAASVEALAVELSRLLRPDTADVDVNTGKRKVDGSRAATRIGVTATERWANERFRQVLLLVLEFRLEWPNRSLLKDADVEVIRLGIDNALFTATSDGHVGDIYDLNPYRLWAIWMVQRAHALKVGGWTVKSTEDRGNVLRFLGYFHTVHGVQVSSLRLGTVFTFPRLPSVTEQFVKHLVTERGVKYASAA